MDEPVFPGRPMPAWRLQLLLEPLGTGCHGASELPRAWKVHLRALCGDELLPHPLHGNRGLHQALGLHTFPMPQQSLVRKVSTAPSPQRGWDTWML